jgi:hypothetical protein
VKWKTGYGDASACLKLRIPLIRRGSAEGYIKSRARKNLWKMARNSGIARRVVLKRGRTDDLDCVQNLNGDLPRKGIGGGSDGGREHAGELSGKNGRQRLHRV